MRSDTIVTLVLLGMLAACGSGGSDPTTGEDAPIGSDGSPQVLDAAMTDGRLLDAPMTDALIDAPMLDAPFIDGGAPMGVSSITMGSFFTCAALDNGALRCWGGGTAGRLGYGNTMNIGDDETPASAGDVPVGGAVLEVSAGTNFACAVLEGGAVRCWGHGYFGALGYGNRDNIGDDELPQSAGNVAVGGVVKEIATGEYHTCALLETGQVKCWGFGYQGRLGYGNETDIGDDETPAAVGFVNVGGPVKQIVAGLSHTCALLENGSVRCWGMGAFGALGYGNTWNLGDFAVPANAGDVAVGGTVTQISAGADHTCALLTTGRVRCWGRAFGGALGYGNDADIGDNETPASAGDVNIGGTVVQISSAGGFNCALLDTHAVRCWGNNVVGQLGYGNTNVIGDNEAPASAGDISIGGSVRWLESNYNHTCAILESGEVRCWGSGYAGGLGYGNTNNIGDNETPASAGNVVIF